MKYSLIIFIEFINKFSQFFCGNHSNKTFWKFIFKKGYVICNPQYEKVTENTVKSNVCILTLFISNI